MIVTLLVAGFTFYRPEDHIIASYSLLTIISFLTKFFLKSTNAVVFPMWTTYCSKLGRVAKESDGQSNVL